MQIIEVRNDILKMAYSPYQNGVLLSDFLLVTEGTKSVLAQVIGIESSQEKDINIATLKSCLSVDETGKISTYLGFIPSTGAEVSSVTQEQVINMLTDEENPIFWGYLAQHDNILFKTDKELLSNKPLILMDDYENYNVILNNIIHINNKLNNKTVIVDFDGTINIDNAFYVKIGEDLKLPLSYDTLNYIYENELKNETLSTQAVIQDIIIELQEYIKTLESGYLPFSTIKNVVYAQYEANKIPELMLLKNKFVKYAQQDFLAEVDDDFNTLNETIEENNLIIIDATEIDTIWHKLLLNYLAKELSTPCYFITKLENENSDKKTILDIYNNKVITPIITANYTHNYSTVMKSIAKNMILFPPVCAVNDFSTYSAFMQKLNRDEYIICGENTLYLNFILRLTYLDSNMAPEYIEKEIQQDVEKLYRSGSQQKTVQPQTNILSEQIIEETSTKPDNYNKMPIEKDSLQQIEDSVAKQTEPIQGSQNLIDDGITEEDLDFLDELEEIPIEETSTPQEQQIVENTQYTNISQEEIVIPQPTPQIAVEERTTQTPIQQEQIEEIVEVQQEATVTIPTSNPVENTMPQKSKEENRRRNVEESTIQQDRPIPPSQPIPIYSVPELEAESPADFKEGNIVYHDKYGRGVIEKMMHYGKKTLCSIQFDDVGRRLLDPNLAGLKQI